MMRKNDKGNHLQGVKTTTFFFFLIYLTAMVGMICERCFNDEKRLQKFSCREE